MFTLGGTTCEERAAEDPNFPDYEIKTSTKIYMSINAGLYIASILTMVYIFSKYVLIRSKCKRKGMIIFYLLMIGQLSVRCAILILLDYYPFVSSMVPPGLHRIVPALFSFPYVHWFNTFISSPHNFPSFLNRKMVPSSFISAILLVLAINKAAGNNE